MRFKIPCEEANHICDKSQYKEASFWQKIKLNIHLLYCNACREYTARNQKLTRLFGKAQLKTMAKVDKERLKQKFHQELKK